MWMPASVNEALAAGCRELAKYCVYPTNSLRFAHRVTSPEQHDEINNSKSMNEQ